MSRAVRLGSSAGVAALVVFCLSTGVLARQQATPAQEPNPPAHFSTMPLHPAQPPAGNQTAGNLLTIIAGPRERGVFTPATLKDYPHVTVTIFNHHINRTETYSGVPLMDLLAPLGVPHGSMLMGKALDEYAVATGSDGYKTVLSLGEIDPAFHPGVVLVADTLDGQPLGAKTGPFRLVVSEDRRPARSVRNLVEIEVKKAE
jgi:DMSO/TMAO reductase YedYZ molybdopterin-dependent catalytic subunit